MDPMDTAMLLIRAWVGVVMLAHGINHARTLDGTARWFEKIGFRSPQMNARVSALSELAMGAGLLVGLLTSVALAGTVATMAVAFWSVHRHAGFFVFRRPDEGYEYVTTLAVAALVIAIVGPGAYSLDAFFGLDEALDGWVGAAIALTGLAAAAVQLAAFYRPGRSGRQ